MCDGNVVYLTHSDIPDPIYGYMTLVTGEDNLENIAISEINSFLNEMNEYEKGLLCKSTNSDYLDMVIDTLAKQAKANDK
jgi:hypothetical protein